MLQTIQFPRLYYNCLLQFLLVVSMQALPGEVVWLRFSKFRATHHKSAIYRTQFCTNMLTLMDGPPFLNTNASLIGLYQKLSSADAPVPHKLSFEIYKIKRRHSIEFIYCRVNLYSFTSC